MKKYYHFVSPLSDFVFSEIFGNERNIDNTKAFLKTLLDIPEEEYGKLTVKDPILRKFTKKGKSGIIDLKLQTKSGKIIHIELQVEKKENMRDRVIYYHARLLADQLKWGDQYGKLQQVVSIVICDHILLEEEDYYLNIYKLQNDMNRAFTNLIKLVIIELPKLPEKEDSAVWHWLRFLKCRKEEELKMLAKRFPDLKKVITVLRELGSIEAWRDVIFHSNLQRMDRYYERQQKIKEARAKGIAEGHTKANLQTARNALAEGLTPEFVQKITGLELEIIEQLANGK